MSETATITPTQFVAFNEELIALLKARIPLELGLAEGTADESSAVEHISARIVQALERGETLVAALEAESNVFPSAYCRIVEAGVKSGNLTTALEAVVGFIHDYLTIRRQITLALIYPLLVLMVSYGLLMTILLHLIDGVGEFYATFRIEVPTVMEFLLRMQETAIFWGWIPPLILLILFFYWLISSRTLPLSSSGTTGLWGWIPGMKSMERNFRWSIFSRMLSLLVEHKNPFPESLVLATDIVGDIPMQTAAREAAEAMNHGDDVETTMNQLKGFPPFLRWVIVHNYQSETLKQELDMASEMYQTKGVRVAEWIKFYFPVFAGVIIGGGVTLFYCLVVFLPLIYMLYSLSG